MFDHCTFKVHDLGTGLAFMTQYNYRSRPGLQSYALLSRVVQQDACLGLDNCGCNGRHPGVSAGFEKGSFVACSPRLAGSRASLDGIHRTRDPGLPSTLVRDLSRPGPESPRAEASIVLCIRRVIRPPSPGAE